MAQARKHYAVSHGKPYGHVPGHTYHDVDGALSETPYGWRCVLTETWGSAQGRNEEHGRQTAAGRAAAPHGAVEAAKAEAKAIGMEWPYVTATCAELLQQAEDDD